MPVRTEYAPGTPSWVDLAAADLDAARDFYGAVFGWQYRDVPMGDGGSYSVALVDGKAVAGLMAAGEGPAGWNTYVTVDDADASVSVAIAEGGATVIAPTDAQEDGRMARITDAVDASIGLWQPKGVAGAELVSEPGGFIWTELLCGDCAKAADFYGSVFGWEAEVMPAPDGSEAMLFSGVEGPVASVRDPKSSLPPTWLVYFACADADECATAITEAGGAIAIAPVDAPFGRMGAAVDSRGAAFAFIATNPEYEPAA